MRGKIKFGVRDLRVWVRVSVTPFLGHSNGWRQRCRHAFAVLVSECLSFGKCPRRRRECVSSARPAVSVCVCTRDDIWKKGRPLDEDMIDAAPSAQCGQKRRGFCCIAVGRFSAKSSFETDSQERTNVSEPLDLHSARCTIHWTADAVSIPAFTLSWMFKDSIAVSTL